MKQGIEYSLYLVTDRDLMSAGDLADAVGQAVRGGCTVVQIREKTASSREFYDQAVAVKAVTDEYGVPLIVNDRVDVALAVGAAGVHVGQHDIPARVVRSIVGPDVVLGVSASNLREAVDAVRDGADYLGVGAMFATDTKAEADLTSMDELRAIRAAVSIPIVVIGGINMRTLPLFAGTGIDGLAVVSAILSQPDIEAAAREMREAFGKIV